MICATNLEEMIGMWSCFHGIHGLEDLGEIKVSRKIFYTANFVEKLEKHNRACYNKYMVIDSKDTGRHFLYFCCFFIRFYKRNSKGK